MTFLVLFFVQDCNLVSLRCDLWGRSLGLPFINAYETEGYVLDLCRTAEWRNQQQDALCGLNKRVTFCLNLSLWPITDQQKVIQSTEMRYEIHLIHELYCCVCKTQIWTITFREFKAFWIWICLIAHEMRRCDKLLLLIHSRDSGRMLSTWCKVASVLF